MKKLSAILLIILSVYVVNLRSINNYFYPMTPDLRTRGFVCGGYTWSIRNGHAFSLWGSLWFVTPKV